MIPGPPPHVPRRRLRTGGQRERAWWIAVFCLAGFDRVPRSTLLLLQAATNVRPEQAVFLPGNDSMGIWSCPHLELLLGTTDVSSPPLRGGAEPRS